MPHSATTLDAPSPSTATLANWQDELLDLLDSGWAKRPTPDLEDGLRRRGFRLATIADLDQSDLIEEAATELLLAGLPRYTLNARDRFRPHLPSEDDVGDQPDVYALHAAGNPPSEIARRLDTSRPRIYWLLKKRGLRPHTRPDRAPELSNRQREAILGSYDTGEPLITIAERVGATYDQVRYLIRKERANG